MTVWTALLAAAASASAQPLATTGSVDGVTATSAALHGVITTSDPNTLWTFEYGTTPSYGVTTGMEDVAAGTYAVARTITGLPSGEIVHYRLVVAGQSSSPPEVAYGNDATFATTAAPTASPNFLLLRTDQVKVRHGIAAVQLFCSGTTVSRCLGTLALTHSMRRSHRRVSCADRSFSLTVGRHVATKVRLSSRCRTLLHAARGHHLTAAMAATLPGQAPLRAALTLAGS